MFCFHSVHDSLMAKQFFSVLRKIIGGVKFLSTKTTSIKNGKPTQPKGSEKDFLFDKLIKRKKKSLRSIAEQFSEVYKLKFSSINLLLQYDPLPGKKVIKNCSSL